jgi:hypothetical protein
MQRLVLFMLVAVTTFPYLSNGDKWHRAAFLPPWTAYVPELLGAMAALLVIALGLRDQFRLVRPAYVLVFGGLLLTMLCGVLANGVDSGPVVSGLRLYLRAVPWFFIPAVFAFSSQQIRMQLYVLLGVCLLQLPLAAEQRIHTASATWGFVAITGDWTTGTMGDSGVLSIFLVGASCIAIALYEKKQLSFFTFLTIFLLILLPTTINETKAVVIFLPVALLVALMCAADARVRVKRLVVGLCVLLMFGAIFVPVYDALNAGREYSSTLGEFFLDKNKVKAYVGSDSADSSDAGRIGSIVYSLRRIAEDPARTAFGYGIGNASDSSLGAGFSGKYASNYRSYMQNALVRFLLELGVCGVLFVFLMYWLIFQDCRRVARSGSTLMAGLGAGWAGVVVLTAMATFYVLLEVYPQFSYVFWYLSGLIAAERMRLAYEVRSSSTEAAVAPAATPRELASAARGVARDSCVD